MGFLLSCVIVLFFFGIILFFIHIITKNKSPKSPDTFQKKSSSFSNKKERIDPVVNSDLTSIDNNSSRYQINIQVSNSDRSLNTDSLSDNYQSINVHGHSLYDPLVTPSWNTSSEMNWSGKGRSITVQGFFIKNPMTYWSKSKILDASCIVKSLNAEIPGEEKLPSLPYWPEYSRLTPAQRGRYLLWMSNGRNSDLDEIGYVFIFFYGLERRAIIEKMDHEEILNEVRRLLVRYPLSGSFNSYLNQLIAYILGSRIAYLKDADIRKFFPEFANLDNYATTNIVLSWYQSQNLPVPWDLCYSLSKTSVEFQKTNIPRKAPELLKQLFKKKFLDQFPQGIPVSTKYDQFQLDYHPASPSLLQYVGYSGRKGLIEPLTVSIPSHSSSQYITLKKIWDDCIEELKPAINKLNKSEGKITRDVYSVLPETLKKEIPHPELESWGNFLSAKSLSDGSIVLPISDIAHQIGIDKRDVLTTSQCKTVTSTVWDFGWLLVPYQTISGTSYKWNDTVAIIPTGNKEKHVSENFPSAALIFELAYGTAASDEKVSDAEMGYLHKFISDRFSLNAFEIECLKGLQRVLENQPPTLSRIGKRLSKYLNPEQKITLANFLGEIVLLDNKFVKEEQKALKTVFKALEMEPAVSDELIKKLLVGHIPEEPITVLKAGKSRKGEVIPPQTITPEFSIDKEKLKQTLDDTRAVQNILASVFKQEEDEIVLDLEPEVKIPKSLVNAETRPNEFDLPFPPETIPSLDSKYLLMLHDIMKSNEVSQDDFTILAKKYNLMPRAAFDDINTWADEELGDFLLEESENRIVINYQK